MFIDGTLPEQQYAKNSMRFPCISTSKFTFEKLKQGRFVPSAKTYSEPCIW